MGVKMDWVNHIKQNDRIQMSICVHPKFQRIYLKPGKVAGTTIFRKALQPMGGWIIKKDNPNEFNAWLNRITDRELYYEYFKFTFARNPFARLVSAWNDIDRQTYPNFDDFVENNILDSDGKPKRLHYQTQTSLFYSSKKKYNFIGKVENINNDWKKYCEITGTDCVSLGHYAKSEHKPYKEYYSEWSMKRVAEIYEDDFKCFKYRRKFNV